MVTISRRRQPQPDHLGLQPAEDLSHGRRRHWGGPVVGGFYLSMGGVHIGLVAADTGVYRDFADAALFGFVGDGWQHIFMAQPAVFGLLLAAGEILLGVLLLCGGRAATVGWIGVIAFHVLLMLFGFGIWMWCIPALTLLVYLARHDDSRATSGGGSSV
jgi:hypothetical protein